MAEISNALMNATERSSPFGGINVVFAGDFCQLPPVSQTRLYSRFASKPGTARGQEAVFGQLLWLSIMKVVLLTKNIRQSGDENTSFVSLLSRFQVCLDWTRSEWVKAPIIVANNETKDIINERATEWFGTSSGQRLRWYYAVNKLDRKECFNQCILEAQIRD
ncbi:hypothetical protein F4604DRAFT_1881099 [Suillus subluteus]|nr:hypothetical protein F4604DRAFT_1881099 [Suillus subluteus]